MSEAIVRQILGEHIESFWGVLTPIKWDDLEFIPTIGTPYIEPRFECVFSQNIAVGCERNFYLLSVLINTVSGDGTVESLVLSDTMKNNCINQSVNGLTFKTGRVVRNGQVNEWYQREVFIDFFYDNQF